MATTMSEARATLRKLATTAELEGDEQLAALIRRALSCPS